MWSALNFGFLGHHAALCCIVVVGFGSAVDVPFDKVVDLTSDDFDAQVQDGNVTAWFVKFYAPWCGHCIHLAPVWDELAGRLQGRVRMAKVDCTSSKSLGSDYDVGGFPTLKLISQRRVYEYEGGRDVPALEAWALGGYKNDVGGPMPSEKTYWQRVWSGIDADAIMLYFVLPVMMIIVVATFVFMTWCQEPPTEEEIAARKHFEDRLRAGEEQMAKKREEKKRKDEGEEESKKED